MGSEMASVEWPRWVAWLMVIAVLLNLGVGVFLLAQLQALREAVGSRNLGVRSRAELEEAFKAGTINRDTYERMKARMS